MTSQPTQPKSQEPSDQLKNVLKSKANLSGVPTPASSEEKPTSVETEQEQETELTPAQQRYLSLSKQYPTQS